MDSVRLPIDVVNCVLSNLLLLAAFYSKPCYQFLLSVFYISVLWVFISQNFAIYVFHSEKMNFLLTKDVGKETSRFSEGNLEFRTFYE